MHDTEAYRTKAIAKDPTILYHVKLIKWIYHGILPLNAHCHVCSYNTNEKISVLLKDSSHLLLVTNPEKVQLIQPPIRIMGRTFVTLPFIMSVNMLGSGKINIHTKLIHTISIIDNTY